MQTFFITGTDTDVGKTVAGALLLKELNKIENRSLGIKPISAGCASTPNGLRNDDALVLQAASGIKVEYEIINPICYAPFIAPHIAAQALNENIELSKLDDCLVKAQSFNPRWLLVEGAGGWRLPLNNQGEFYSDFAGQQKMRVVLVVGMKLGCLNHAILTLQAIQADGLECVGWIANQLSADMPYYRENIHTLERILNCPKLAEIPYQPNERLHIKTSPQFLKVFA